MPQILSLEWFDNGREQELVVPVLSYLKYYFGYEIICSSAFNTFKILSYRPDAVLIAGIEGSARQTEWAKRFNKIGVPVFGITTEGIFNQQVASEFIWGHTPKDESPLWNKRFLWNQPSLKITKQVAPEIAKISKVTGNPAADKYVMQKLVNFDNKTQSLPSQKIGLALTDAIQSERILTNIAPHYLNQFLSNLQDSVQILTKFVVDNPEYQFIARSHPADNGKQHQIYEKLTKLTNVEFQSESSSLYDFLSQSSALIVFNSSLVVDANLIGIPSIKVGKLENPGEYYNHIPVANNAADLKIWFSKTQQIKKYIGPVDTELIKATYGNADGMNHKRIAIEINKMLTGRNKSINSLFEAISLRHLLREILSWHLHKLILFLLPSLKYERFNRIKKYDADLIYSKIEDYHSLQDAFFKLKNPNLSNK